MAVHGPSKPHHHTHLCRKLSEQCLQVPEFGNLPATIIESLAHVLTEKVFPPKGVIYYQGNEVEEVFFVQQGRVKVARLLPFAVLLQ